MTANREFCLFRISNYRYISKLLLVLSPVLGTGISNFSEIPNASVLVLKSVSLHRWDGTKFDSYIVGVAGGSGSGKTSVSEYVPAFPS
ncbi:9832_t:CDS:2 [Cetraspora pellucida]|uniref:9832_t:CDS:1 n=1 Tax=Cetraspora pellucida TaxID=1433469 RepID=A0ACA9LCL5_9GLOM|nr:9832_t:CDS:2 [Cetraspora pellucida]